jgi:translation initiation factor IF-1
LRSPVKAVHSFVHIKMPGKGYGKAKLAAKRNNEQRNKIVIQESDALFGRTLKSLGNCRFRIQTTDTDGRGVETDAVIGGKSVVRINIGDIVIVGRNETSARVTYEILGACDKKTVKQLRDAKRLHPSLVSNAIGEDDDLFDREDDDPDAKKEMEDEEVNVDAI